MTGSDVRAALAEAGVIPSKRLGQNFLTDPETARWIVDQLEPEPEDFVVEVGPGTGALSEALVGRVGKILLLEFDRRLAEWLKRRFAGENSVEVVHADGAQYDLRTLFKEQPVKLLGNLPYSAGGAILRNFMQRPSPVVRAVLMMQKEVIDRILAVPRTKNYGVLSLRMQSEWDSASLKTIGPEVFHPRPTIDSTVMLVEPRKGELPVYDARLFDELARRGFAQRRKQVRKAMPPEPVWGEVAAAIGVVETARAEELSLEQWVELTRLYDPHPLSDLPQRGDELFDVVDEKDEVVRQERREVVHAEDLLHRAIHAFVFNKRGEVFLQKRSRLKDTHPGRWDSSASGHLDAGEGYDACVVRELEEEVGQSGEGLELLAKLSPCAATGWEFVQLYRARQDQPLRYPCAEVEAGLWLAPEEVSAWIAQRPQDFATGFLECWKVRNAVR